MSHPVLVSQATFADLEPVAALFDRYRQFQGQQGDAHAARAFLRARFDHGESIVFVARIAAQAIGLAQVYPMFSSVALKRVFVLNDLFVDPAARRRRVASELLRAVEAYAWAHDAARVTLSVARDNRVAQALYEARGWARDEQFDMYHRRPVTPEPLSRRTGSRRRALPMRTTR